VELNDTNYEMELSRVDQGILLFHKKLCPHCLNMRKVIEKFMTNNASVIDLFIDSEDNPGAMKMMDIERVPTLLIIKEGIVVARKTGLINPRELGDLYQKSHP
jgi:thioredoxin 1